MKKLLVITALVLSGCDAVQINPQSGSCQIDKLHQGMSEDEVRSLMGSPTEKHSMKIVTPGGTVVDDFWSYNNKCVLAFGNGQLSSYTQVD